MWNQYCIDLLLRSYNIIVVCCHHNEWFFARPKSYWSNFFAPLPLLLFHFLLYMVFSGSFSLNSRNLSIFYTTNSSSRRFWGKQNLDNPRIGGRLSFYLKEPFFLILTSLLFSLISVKKDQTFSSHKRLVNFSLSLSSYF